MNQKVGNFPGVTVDKLIGFYPIDEIRTARVIDLPGTYSLYPRSEDEQIALQVLGSPGNPDYPSVVVVVVDAPIFVYPYIRRDAVSQYGVARCADHIDADGGEGDGVAGEEVVVAANLGAHPVQATVVGLIAGEGVAARKRLEAQTRLARVVGLVVGEGIAARTGQVEAVSG